MRIYAFIAAALALAACDDFQAPSDLDHAQILAVRAAPAQLAPGGVARIDLLVTDQAGQPAAVPPDEAAIAGAAGARLDRDERGLVLRAPGEAELDAARAALGLPGDAPVPIPLRVTVAIDGVPKTADKVLFVGRHAENPEIAALAADDAPVPDDGLAFRRGTSPRLAAAGTGGEGALRYAWYSGVGELERYRSAEARLLARDPGAGHLVVVVRDEQGGVGWRIVPARVE